MTAATGTAHWFCPVCGASNASQATACVRCGGESPVSADDDVMADLRGANVLKSSARGVAPLENVAHREADDRSARARALSGIDSTLPAGATMQLPSIEDLRATGSLAATGAALAQPAPGEATAEYPAQKGSAAARRWRPSPQLMRALPLALLAALAAAALTWVGVRQPTASGAGEAAAPPTAGAQPSTVTVEAREATIGLTEDNKEAVLSLCFRASDNPNTECRRAYLEQLGEYPHRTQAFGPLRADVFEVANAWYDACVATGACAERNIETCQYFTARRREIGRSVPETLLAPDRPAVCVTRDEAAAFCAWRQMRLPGGDEWERLARAATDRLQPWGNFWTPAILNWGERDMVGFVVAGRLDGHELSAPVDAFFDGRTTEGLYQMFGNVAEWTTDDAEGSGMGEIRGGSYADDSRGFRATRAESIRTDERRTTVGFRCVGDP